MNAILLRVGALGTLIVLGWIAMANAQRNADEPFAERNAPAMLPQPTDDANPLRTASPQPTKANSKSSKSPMNDPFGPQSQRSRAVVPASSEQPESGPNLTVGDANPQSAARYGNNNNAGQRYPLANEPAPFKADPFAVPANQNNEQNSTRNAFTEPARGFSNPPAAKSPQPAVEDDGIGQPGGKQFEGVQAPQLSIQKVAPREIQVGRQAAFRVVVRNTGQVPACEVEIHDLVPKGTRLLGTTPQAAPGARGQLVWKLGIIQPGEESAVEMQLMPTTEGEIGSVATVHFGADASARSIATRPQLVVETTGPAKVLIGEKAMLTITISNPGTGVAAGVVIEEKIPPSFKHPAGTELEYEVGNLKPGESRKLELPLVANRPGPATNLLSARGEGNLRAEHKLNIEVLAPLLDVALEGPKRRYLERQAVYQLSVTNPGTAPAKQVELLANLPAGLKFVSANNAGYYEEASRTVRWRLEELPANETGSVELVTMPVEAGQHAIKLRGTAQRGLNVEKEQPVMVEGIAAVLFQVADSVDPIEVGGETTYEVRVVNQGSKAASNVRLAVQLPPELKPTAAEGPARYAFEGDRVIFEGLSRLAPKADTVYRIRVKAAKAGDLRTRFQLLTDDMQTPVTKEESTRVFADE